MSPAVVQFPTSYIAYAITERGGKLQKIEVPWKYPRAGEIVVRVLACGVCATCVPSLLPARPPARCLPS